MAKLTPKQRIESLRTQIQDFKRQGVDQAMIDELQEQLNELELRLKSKEQK